MCRYDIIASVASAVCRQLLGPISILLNQFAVSFPQDWLTEEMEVCDVKAYSSAGTICARYGSGCGRPPQRAPQNLFIRGPRSASRSRAPGGHERCGLRLWPGRHDSHAGGDGWAMGKGHR